MRICNYKRAGLVLSLLFFHVKSLAAPYYRLKSTKPLLRFEGGSAKARRSVRDGDVAEGEGRFKVGRERKGDLQLRLGNERRRERDFNNRSRLITHVPHTAQTECHCSRFDHVTRHCSYDKEA